MFRPRNNWTVETITSRSVLLVIVFLILDIFLLLITVYKTLCLFTCSLFLLSFYIYFRITQNDTFITNWRSDLLGRDSEGNIMVKEIISGVIVGKVYTLNSLFFSSDQPNGVYFIFITLVECVRSNFRFKMEDTSENAMFEP